MKPTVFHDIGQLMTMGPAQKKSGRQVTDKDLGVIRNAAMAVEAGKIVWVGKAARLPEKFSKWAKKSLNGLNVFPGFVDCHTHMVFAGDRKHEFELRNKGVSYQQIAKNGGGILSTVKETRKASLKNLVDLAQNRVAEHLKQGVTTVEIKSGYGLNRSSEEKMLKAAKSLKKINVVTTYLGAHAIPKEFKNQESYLEQLQLDLLRIKKMNLSSRVDIFIEKNYFSYRQAELYLQYAKELGFEITIHADQLSRSQAAKLAVKIGAKSADHVICLNSRDKKLMADSDVTAVLLPCADFYLQCNYPDARTLIDMGARVALASDFNPGSSPTQSMSLLGVLSRLNMKMSLSEVFVAMTLGGASALALETKGALCLGYDADFFTSDKIWTDFFYDMSPVPVKSTYIAAKKVF